MPVSAYYRDRTVYRIGSTIGQCEQAVNLMLGIKRGGRYGLFTRNMCIPVCVNVNFNIVLMVTQTHTWGMGLKAIPCISHSLNVRVDVDANGHAHVTCKQSFKMRFHLTQICSLRLQVDQPRSLLKVHSNRES